jgi:hypothetical protein
MPSLVGFTDYDDGVSSTNGNPRFDPWMSLGDILE